MSVETTRSMEAADGEVLRTAEVRFMYSLSVVFTWVTIVVGATDLEARRINIFT